MSLDLSKFTVRAPGPKTSQNTVDYRNTVVDEKLARNADFVTTALTMAVQPTECAFASAYPQQLSLNQANPSVPRVDSRNVNVSSTTPQFKRLR